MDRWATFDCYGTLVDWNAGIGGELARLFGEEHASGCSSAYHGLEPVIEHDGSLPYREVMARTLAGVAEEAGLDLPDGERDALGRSLPGWPVFPEVRPALEEARARGWKLAILSNTDRDFIEASRRRSACRSSWRSWPARSARTSRRTGTGARSRSRPAPTGRRTCTSPPASSTTSRPRSSSGCRSSGSTGSASEPTRGRPASCRICRARRDARRARAGVTIRTPTREDAGAIAGICNALSRDYDGGADLDERSVGDWFGFSDLAMFLAEDDGRPLGYLDIRDEEPLRFPVDLRVHPSARATSIADELLDAAEQWARERAAADAVLRGYAPERDGEAQRVLTARGYPVIRHSFLMEIALHDALEEPDWPERLTLRTFDRERDEQAVYEVQEEAFSDHWDYHPTPIEHWREFSVDSAYFDPDLWWLVEDGDALAAICLNSWHFSGDPTFGWVGVLGVRRPWRRRGLGLALLRHSFRDFAARDATRVGLGVDAENTTGAVRLYERAGMRPVRRNDTFERPVHA